MRRLAAAAAAVALALGCASGEGMPSLEALLGAASGMASGGGTLDDATVVAGLREALEVSTRNAVDRTSRPGGFLEDPRLHIPLPEPLAPVARTLRAVGMGSQLDALEVAMNRAAEQAAAEAAPVFLDAIRNMTFADARGILQGGDTAATEYFRRATQDELRRRFEPIVDQKVQQVGVAQLYGSVVSSMRALPMAPASPPDIETYVTDRALDGLFMVLAEEEQRIRRDPAARTTELLRRVFGSGG